MRKARILLAEDHVAIRKIIGLVVAEEQHELLEASDGLEALEMARRLKPDLVLLDLGLPRLDGLEVCRRLRAEPDMRGTRIIALTARVTPAERDLAVRAGVDEYITKPFGPMKLLGTIRRMLGHSPAPSLTTTSSIWLTAHGRG